MEDSVGYLLVQVAKGHRARIAAAVTKLGLHVGQELVLLQLWAEEGLTQSALAERLGVEPPTVTKMLQRMEKAGLVKRQADPADARLSRVYASAEGRELEAPIRAAWAAVEQDMLRNLSVEERIVLRRLLLQMREDL